MNLNAISEKISDQYDKYVPNSFIDTWWNKLKRDDRVEPIRFELADYVIAAVFICLAVIVSIYGFSITSRAPGLFYYKNVWFQADIYRVIENMTNRESDHWRTSVHPITSILFYPFGFLLTKLGLAPLQACRVVVVAFSAMNPALLFFTLRQIKLPRPVAAIFTLLFLASAAVIFWSSVVELYPVACLSILPALFLMARGPTGKRIWWVLASAFTLSITITNWMIGLIATFVRWNLKPFLVISLAAFALVLVLAIPQLLIFKDARLFINPHGLKFEAVSFSEPVMQATGQLHEKWNPVANVQVLFVGSAVATPARKAQQNAEFVATTQSTPFARDDYAGYIGVVAWIGLLALGIWGAIRNTETRVFSIGLGLMLLANGLLHAVYGEVTFLYTMHVIPMLTILAALSWFSPYKWAGVGLALVVIVAGGSNNVQQLNQSTGLAARIVADPNVRAIQTNP